MGSREPNWGWNSPGIKREGYPENHLDQAYANKTRSEDDEEVRNDMGVMLRQLGIAPEMLGWDEDAEVFVD